VSLLTELSAVTLLIIAVTVIHGTGIGLMDKFFDHEARELRKLKLAKREFA